MNPNLVELILVDEIFHDLPIPVLTTGRPFKSNFTAVSMEYLSDLQESSPDFLEDPIMLLEVRFPPRFELVDVLP